MLESLFGNTALLVQEDSIAVDEGMSKMVLFPAHFVLESPKLACIPDREAYLACHHVLVASRARPRHSAPSFEAFASDFQC